MRRDIKGEILGGIQGPWVRGVVVLLHCHFGTLYAMRPGSLLGPAVGRRCGPWFGW